MTTTASAADPDVDLGNSSVSGRGGETISYKPKLFRMLANNNRIDTEGDELRMDFVLRVAHGQVDTVNPKQCAAGVSRANRSCGLKLNYSFNAKAGDQSGSNIKEIAYTNTTASDSSGAEKWAKNKDEYYTIHAVLNSGVYDYLIISVECDIDYPNNVDQTQLGGVTMPQYVYAQVSDSAGNWSSDNYGWQESEYLTNIAADYPANVYSGSCRGSGASAQCSGPVSFIGWNNTLGLWSKGQANWGLVTDHGLTVDRGVSYPEGLAPPSSFFTYWVNAAPANAPCSKNTSFYFQWFGLQGGSQWVPVTSLTPQAQRVDGQVRTNRNALGASGSAKANSAFNIDVANGHDIRAKQGPDGTLSPAQHSDGTIDFKAAKDAQGLDGYFKLVTWPITTDSSDSMASCVAPGATRDAYNPLYGQEQGVTLGMSQADTKTLVDKGWTIDTGFYRYSLPDIAEPVIDTPDENAYVHRYPTLEGTGEEGSVVELYAENPANPIDEHNPDDIDRRGRFVGRATVNRGRWSIQDMDNAVTNGSVRYHAWQIEQKSGYGLTSGFSNIRKVRLGQSQAPTLNASAIVVPHTKRNLNGELETDARVHISGTAAPIKAGDTLKVYATHATQSTLAAVAARNPNEADLVGECTRPGLTAGSQEWSCEVSPSYFLNQLDRGDTYLFRAKLVDSDGLSSSFSAGSTLVKVDMTPPRVVMDPNPARGKLSGRAYRLPSGSAVETNVPIVIAWPNGTTGRTATGADGGWSIDVPEGMISGEVKIAADDASDASKNESGWVVSNLKVAAALKSLPFTGDHSRLFPILAGAIAALLAVGAAVYLCIDRMTKSGKAVRD